MIQWRSAVIEEVRSRWAGAVEYAARLASGDTVRALGYSDILGDLPVGTRVLLNTTALERGLGTGGVAIIVAAPDHLPEPVDVPALDGHLVKARYTPGQTMVLGVDEQGSPATTSDSRTPTTSAACLSSSRTSTRPCRPSLPA